jgi:predicted transcriptional regulator
VLLDRLADRRCRAVLAATTDAARSAREVATRCDLPLSTTYRKLDHLVEAGLLTERTRVRCAGKHPSEFRRAVDEVVVDVRPSGKTHLVVMDRSPGQ